MHVDINATVYHRNSSIGNAAFAASVAQRKPIEPGFVFKYDGNTYRVTHTNVNGLRSYFAVQRVISRAAFIQTMRGVAQPGSIPIVPLDSDAMDALVYFGSSLQASLAKMKADQAAPKSPEPAPVNTEAAAPFGTPLAETPCACCTGVDAILTPEEAATELSAIVDHLDRHGLRSYPGNSIADDVAGVLDILKSSEEEARRHAEAGKSLIADLLDAREVLHGFGHHDDGAPLSSLIRALYTEMSAAIDMERRRAGKAEALAKSASNGASNTMKWAQSLERDLHNIKAIVDKSELIPF